VNLNFTEMEYGHYLTTGLLSHNLFIRSTPQVAVRCRPLTAKEKLKSRDILRVVEGKVSTTLPWRISSYPLTSVLLGSSPSALRFDLSEC
jgi:hypothetical protein